MRVYACYRCELFTCFDSRRPEFCPVCKTRNYLLTFAEIEARQTASLKAFRAKQKKASPYGGGKPGFIFQRGVGGKK